MERFAASRSDSPAAALRSASFSVPDEASVEEEAAAAAARVLAEAGPAAAVLSPDLAGTVDGEGAEEAAGDDFLAAEPRSITFPSLSCESLVGGDFCRQKKTVCLPTKDVALVIRY